MESPQEKNETLKQLCTITVAFPVESDDQAIAYKRKIGLAMADHSEARIEFRIMNMGRYGPPVR